MSSGIEHREDGQVGVALVGCGAMGEMVGHRIYAHPGQLAGYRVVTVVDKRHERRAKLGALFGVNGYSSLEEAAGAGAPIDAVDIRVPHDAHAEVALEAINHGWHVLIEKPLAATLVDADRIVRAATKRGVVAAVAENYPHLLAVRAAANAIRTGGVGELRGLRTTRATTLEGVWDRDGWRRRQGILLDQGAHQTSMLRQLGGEIVGVSAEMSRPISSPDRGGETVLVTSRFASGLAAQSFYSWGTVGLDDDAEGTVFGSKARIEVRVAYDGVHGGAYCFSGTGESAVAISPPENYFDTHRVIIDDWVSCIRHGGVPVVTPDEARKDVAVVVAATQSLAEDGHAVEVPGLARAGRLE